MRNHYQNNHQFEVGRHFEMFHLLDAGWIRFLLAILIVTMSFAVVAQPGKNCGTGQTITWSEDQAITGIFVVAPEDVLEILPGVKVEFQTAASGLQVLGTIQAEGTAQNPVLFEGLAGSTWSGVDLINACPSEFRHCRFTGINRTGLKGQVRNSGGFNVSATSDVSIIDCTFLSNFDAIEVVSSSNISFIDCTFQSNEVGFSENGFIYLRESNDVLIKGNYFFQNKVSMKGLLNINDGSQAVVLDNTFSNTTFAGAIFFGSLYPVILARTDILNTQVVINGNSFLNNRAPNNQKLAEVQITGKDNSIDQLTAFIWNNNFVGYPFPLPGATPKGALRINSAVATISGNNFRYYNDFAVRVLKSESKINLNNFENNQSALGAVNFDSYPTYSGRAVENVVFANVFDNNRAQNGAAIMCMNVSGNLVKTTIHQNIFNNNQALNNGGAIFASQVSNVFIQNNSFTDNSAVNGGAVHLSGVPTGSKLPLNNVDGVTLSDNIFAGNISSQNGGGLYVEDADNITFTRNLFNTNSGSTGAGAFVLNSSAQFYNCNFYSNQSPADGGGLFLDVTENQNITVLNCNFVNHADAGGLVITDNIQPSEIHIFNSLFFGNNSGTTGKAIVFNAPQDVVTNNCYFDIFPSTYSVENLNPQQEIWPGWIDDANFYLDCEVSVCVDNGNSDALYNDIEADSPGQALFPSCGLLINDIGISGGPYAADKPWIFQPETIIAKNVAHKSKDLKNQIHFSTASFHENQISENDVTIFPNPSDGQLFVLIDPIVEEDVSLVLLNTHGQKIFERSISTVNQNAPLLFDLAGYPKGIYFMMISNRNHAITEKIILN